MRDQVEVHICPLAGGVQVDQFGASHPAWQRVDVGLDSQKWAFVYFGKALHDFHSGAFAQVINVGFEGKAVAGDWTSSQPNLGYCVGKASMAAALRDHPFWFAVVYRSCGHQLGDFLPVRWRQ